MKLGKTKFGQTILLTDQVIEIGPENVHGVEEYRSPIGDDSTTWAINYAPPHQIMARTIGSVEHQYYVKVVAAEPNINLIIEGERDE